MAAMEALCAHAFDVVVAKTSGSPAPAEPPGGNVGGVFVTWNHRSRGDWDLRGCIGTLTPTKLGRGVSNYAHVAAFEDPRFDPIRASELPSLQVGISVLHNFVAAPGVHEWVVGEHGLILNFSAKGNSYSATYLPEVAKEQGWDQKTAIDNLVAKAGFDGRRSDIEGEMSLTTYQSSKCAMTHAEYLAYKARA